MMNDKSTKMALSIVACAAVLAGTMYYLTHRPNGGPEGGGRQERRDSPRKNPELDQLHGEAMKLQEQGQWCEAEKKWQELVEKQDAGGESGAAREEAEKNERLCAEHCRPLKPPVTEKKIEPPARPPEHVPQDELVAAYPQGRKVRSIAYLLIDGKGTHDDWVFRGSVNFHYQYRVEVETNVKENRGVAVIFEQRFESVDQLRAVSDQELEFRWPESLILDEVRARADDGLAVFPQYRVAKVLAKTFDTIDPDGKKTLTRLQKFIPRLPDGKHLEIIQKLEELSGQRMEVEYVSGLGVTRIKVLDGRQLDPDLLDHVARGSTVLMDYFLKKSATEAKKGSGPFDLDTKDVGDMFNLADKGRVDGGIQLRRVDGDAESLQEFEIEDGKLEVEVDENGATRRVVVTPKSGTVRYSPSEMLVQFAQATWHADSTWETTDHLLVGAKATGDIKIRTHYEAKLLSPGDKDK